MILRLLIYTLLYDLVLHLKIAFLNRLPLVLLIKTLLGNANTNCIYKIVQLFYKFTMVNADNT